MSDQDHETKCNALLGNLSEYIDGELRADLCAQIEEHMKTCENCRVVVNTLQKTVELFERCNDPCELPEAIRERLFAKLEISDFLKTRHS